MLGERRPQWGLFEADSMYADFVGRKTFYGFLASERGELFKDEDFAGLYCVDNGRPSVPPSLLATALVLQTYDGASDDEAKQRADYDLRWKVALGVGLDERPFAKSTLQEFRAQLIIHREQAAVFRRSLELAKRRGYLKHSRKLKLALDTTAILGRGAVKDTYNLLADGIVLVVRALAKQAGEPLAAWAERHGFGRYVSGPSLKGQAEIDWSDRRQRRQFLQEVVADAGRVLELARAALLERAEGSPEEAALVEAAGLLGRVLVQDIEPKPDGPALKQGVAEGRLMSVHDPDMRHGHKSKSQRFDGHKAQLAVDTDSQLVTAVAVLPGNAPDAEEALVVVEQTEADTGCEVDETIGDCAYGSGPTRQAFEAAGRTLIAKVPAESNQGRFTKSDFQIDLTAGTCTCPAGQTTGKITTPSTGRLFHFAAAVCRACPLRAQCVKGRGGRSIRVHPQEALLQKARALQASPAFREYRARRQGAEHRIARLAQLGIRQARYFGRTKTLFQLYLAAAVANLTLLANAASGRAGSTALAGLFLALAALLLAHSSRLQRHRPLLTAYRGPTRSSFPLTPARPSVPTWALKTPACRPSF